MTHVTERGTVCDPVCVVVECSVFLHSSLLVLVCPVWDCTEEGDYGFYWCRGRCRRTFYGGVFVGFGGREEG